MELFQAKDHYILQQGERALWCSRRDGGLELRPGEAGGAGSPWARAAAGGRGEVRAVIVSRRRGRSPGPRPSPSARTKGPRPSREGRAHSSCRRRSPAGSPGDVGARDPWPWRPLPVWSGLWPGPRDELWVRIPVSARSEPGSAARAVAAPLPVAMFLGPSRRRASFRLPRGTWCEAPSLRLWDYHSTVSSGGTWSVFGRFSVGDAERLAGPRRGRGSGCAVRRPGEPFAVGKLVHAGGSGQPRPEAGGAGGWVPPLPPGCQSFSPSPPTSSP